MTKKQKLSFLNLSFGKDKNDDDWTHPYHQGETSLFHEENAKKALSQFERALEISRKKGDRKGEGYSLEMLGEVLPIIEKEQDDIKYLNRAIEYSETALRISQEINDRTLEGKVLRTLAMAHMRRNDNNSAIEHLEKSIAVFREIGNLEEIANSLTALAFLLQKTEQVDRSQQVAREASHIRTDILSHKAQSKK
jgi:tetratricopeptide (TPR) repeat protein